MCEKRTSSFRVARLISIGVVSLGLAVASHASSTPGSLDLTFGNGGTGRLDIWGPNLPVFEQAEAFGAAFQSVPATASSPAMTYLVSAGRCATYSGAQQVCVTRFATYGADQGWVNPTNQFGNVTGQPGVAALPISIASFSGLSVGVAVQSDGRIVVASGCRAPASTVDAFCVARFTTSGALDATFGDGGIGVVMELPFNRPGMASRILVQPDGKIVVGGNCNDATNSSDLCVLRLTAGGGRDVTFGTNGFAVLPSVGTDKAWALLRQPADGKLIIAGNCAGDFCAVRLHTTGQVDATFGVAGRLTTSFGTSDDKVFGIVRQKTGKLVLGGYCRASNGLDDICVARYNSDGTLDASFGTAGKVRVNALPGSSSRAYGVAVQQDDQIVVGGLCGTTSAYSVCWLRLNSNGSIDGIFGPSGVMSNVPVYSAPAGGFMNDLKPRGSEVMYGVGACFDQIELNWTMCAQRYSVCNLSKWENCGNALQGTQPTTP